MDNPNLTHHCSLRAFIDWAEHTGRKDLAAEARKFLEEHER